MSIKGFNNYGRTTIETDPGTGQVALFNTLMQSFNLSSEEENTDVMGYPIGGNGFLEVIYNMLTSRTYNVEIGDVFDWGCLQMAFQAFQSVTSSIVFRKSYVGRVPETSPYEIVDAANLTGLTESDISLSILTTTTDIFTPLEVVGVAPAATDEVQLDEPNTKLVFDSSQAGKSVSYHIAETLSNVRTLGVEQTQKVLDRLSFTGTMQNQSAPNGIIVDIPTMSRIGGFTIQPGENNTMQFRPIVEGDNISPVRFAIAA